MSQILKGEIGVADGQERQDLIDYFLAAQEGPLACERIVDVLEASGYSKAQPPTKPLGTYLQGWLFTKLKAGLTNLHMRRPGPNRLAYHNHRFPGISVEEIEQKTARFGDLLKRFDKIKVAPYAKHVFRISA